MDYQLAEELRLALSCADFSAHPYEYDIVREIVHEQVRLMTGVLRIPLPAAGVFIEKAESSDERHPAAVWIGTAEHILRVDMSASELRSTDGFRAEIIRPIEITDLDVTATKWYGEKPLSDSTLSVEFSSRDRRFRLAARMRNCEQLQKLLRMILESRRHRGAD